jgi:hypothetical protein
LCKFLERVAQSVVWRTALDACAELDGIIAQGAQRLQTFLLGVDVHHLKPARPDPILRVKRNCHLPLRDFKVANKKMLKSRRSGERDLRYRLLDDARCGLGQQGLNGQVEVIGHEHPP